MRRCVDANVTKGDLVLSEREQMQGATSMLERVRVLASPVVSASASSAPPRLGLNQEQKGGGPRLVSAGQGAHLLSAASSNWETRDGTK